MIGRGYNIHNRPWIQYGPGLGKGHSASTNMSDLPMILFLLLLLLLASIIYHGGTTLRPRMVAKSGILTALLVVIVVVGYTTVGRVRYSRTVESGTIA